MQTSSDESESTTVPNGMAHDDRLRAQALRGIRRDLRQLGHLLDDAVGRLTATFDTLSTHGEAQHRLLARLATQAGTTPAAAIGADLDALQSAFEGGIAETVTALQFHDIASQILGQLAGRVDVLDHVAATDTDPAQQAGDRDDGSTVDHEFTRTPVTQANMTAGAVQLF